MKRVFLLQDLDLDREETGELLVEAGCRHRPIWPDDPDLANVRGEVEVLVTAQHHVGAEVLDPWPALKMVSLAFTGYDQVNLDLARSRGIRVYYVPGYATDSVAELTVGLTLAVLRRIPLADRTTREGKWDSATRPGVELAGKTVGIAGTGTIGLASARLFKAFGCRLLGWSRTLRSELADLGGTYVGWDDLFSRSEVVALHLPLSDETRHIVAGRELSLMKPDAVLVNTSRSELVEMAALIETLKVGRIRAGLDVFDAEPAPADHELMGLENAVLTPHLGFKTGEALRRLAEITLENIGRFLRSDPTHRLV